MWAIVQANLPALQVVTPLMAAPICALIGRHRLGWFIAMATMVAAFAISLALFFQVLDGTVISYELGNWAPPVGIEYRVDIVNAFLLVIISGTGLLVLPYALQSVVSEIAESQRAYFYTAFLLCFTGLLGVTITGDAFNVFVFLEISSLSTYALVAMGAGKDRRALTAAYNYLVMGTIGATFFVIGIGFLYMITGTLNMADLAERITTFGDSRALRVAFTFIFIGLGLKFAMFPLHMWLPNAYAFAPSVVTAFLAATATKVAIYVLLRFMYTVFGFDYPFQAITLDVVVLPLAIIAMFAASMVAIFQVDLKRMLAYSSVAQIGYILLGLCLQNEAGLAAAMIHLFNHAVAKGALFLVMGCIVLRLGSSRLPDLAGIGRQMPLTMAAFVVGGLSLIGVPLTVGFVSKWYLIEASLDRGWWWLAFLIVASSLLAVVYVWRVVEVAYLKPAPAIQHLREAPPLMLLSTLAMAALCLYFGINAELTSEAALRAADQLLGTPLRTFE